MSRGVGDCARDSNSKTPNTVKSIVFLVAKKLMTISLYVAVRLKLGAGDDDLPIKSLRSPRLSLLQEVAEAVGATAGGDAAFSGLDHPVDHADAFADHGAHICDKASLIRF